MMKKPDFLHANTNSSKVKVDWKMLGGYGHKWLCPLWSQDSKIGCISRRKWL